MLGRKADPEERARQQEEKARQRTEKALQRDADRRRKAAEKQIKRYWSSLSGMARRAYDNGESLYEWSATPMSISSSVSSVYGRSHNRRGFSVVGTLTAIERSGWRLEHAGYAFVGGTSASRDKMFTSQQEYTTSGEVKGFYLFRRVDDVKQVAPLDVLAAAFELEQQTGTPSEEFPELSDPEVRAAFVDAAAEAGDLVGIEAEANDDDLADLADSED